MLATMVARLLETSPVEVQEEAARSNSVVGSILGGGDTDEAILAGLDPQHVIVSGLGAMPSDSDGNRWSAAYIVASGNLMSDFRFNVAAESQGRQQVARLYQLTDDAGVRDVLSFLLAHASSPSKQGATMQDEARAAATGKTPPSSRPKVI